MSRCSPCRYRREGRNAFDISSDPYDVCPYHIGAYYNAANHRKWWLEGWDQARLDYWHKFKQEQETNDYENQF